MGILGEGILARLFGTKQWFSSKRGYFQVFHKRVFLLKAPRIKRAISEKSTILQKSCRTPKFIPARGENANSHLGGVLLRSARSFLDGSAFVSVTEPTDATDSNPQTAGTSSPVA